MNLATAHGIEGSHLYFAIVTKAFMAEKGKRDEISYAKALGKPFALAIEKGVDPGSWFDGCNVIGRITFDRGNLNQKQIADWLKSMRDSLGTVSKRKDHA